MVTARSPKVSVMASAEVTVVMVIVTGVEFPQLHCRMLKTDLGPGSFSSVVE